MRMHVGMVLGLLSMLPAGAAAGAESPLKVKEPVEIVTHQRSFRMPFAHDATTGDLGGVITLFVSTDEGKTWEVASKVSPDQRGFTFRAPRDGVYWFAVRDAHQGGESDTTLSPTMKVKVDTGDRAEEKRPEPGRNDPLEEARLDVELLELELSTQKTQLQQSVQRLTQLEFGSVGRGGMGGDPEQRKQGIASHRERFAELKSIALATGKKLAEARRKLAAIEGRTEHFTTSESPLASHRLGLAEQRARVALLELEFDVDRAILREAMLKLGKEELEQSISPAKGDGADDLAKATCHGAENHRSEEGRPGQTRNRAEHAEAGVGRNRGAAESVQLTQVWPAVLNGSPGQQLDVDGDILGGIRQRSIQHACRALRIELVRDRRRDRGAIADLERQVEIELFLAFGLFRIADGESQLRGGAVTDRFQLELDHLTARAQRSFDRFDEVVRFCSPREAKRDHGRAALRDSHLPKKPVVVLATRRPRSRVDWLWAEGCELFRPLGINLIERPVVHPLGGGAHEAVAIAVPHQAWHDGRTVGGRAKPFETERVPGFRKIESQLAKAHRSFRTG